MRVPNAPAAESAGAARERRFDLDELFFSSTDAKGIIRSGNEVFVRVSGYARENLVGRAHNVVRHPDMPRAVFRLLWDRLGDGHGVTAYVKNRAADRSHYWVLATLDAAPGGFVSVRVKPSSPMFAVARSVYADVLAVEQRVEDGDVRRRKASIDAGVALLHELLAGAGFANYDAFIEAVLPAEVQAREAALGASAGDRLGTASPDGDPALAAILATLAAAHDDLDALGANLDEYRALHDTLAPKSAYAQELAESIRLFPLNALLAATRLGDRGVALGAVADIMRGRSQTRRADRGRPRRRDRRRGGRARRHGPPSRPEQAADRAAHGVRARAARRGGHREGRGTRPARAVGERRERGAEPVRRARRTPCPPRRCRAPRGPVARGARRPEPARAERAHRGRTPRRRRRNASGEDEMRERLLAALATLDSAIRGFAHTATARVAVAA